MALLRGRLFFLVLPLVLGASVRLGWFCGTGALGFDNDSYHGLSHTLAPFCSHRAHARTWDVPCGLALGAGWLWRQGRAGGVGGAWQKAGRGRYTAVPWYTSETQNPRVQAVISIFCAQKVECRVRLRLGDVPKKHSAKYLRKKQFF